jgi:serine/threonine protein kinase
VNSLFSLDEEGESVEEYVLPDQLFILSNDGSLKPIKTDSFQKLGTGGTSTVYRCFAGIIEGKVIKLYKPAFLQKHRDEYQQKIDAMLASKPNNMNLMIDGKLYFQFVWPEGAVFDQQQQFIGFYMPYVDISSTYDCFLYLYEFESLDFEVRSVTERMQVACNLAAAVNNLHRAGHYFVDLKPQNMAIYKGVGLVLFMDCDGFSISKGQFPARHFSPGYIAPEAIKHKSTPEQISDTPYQDYYALSVLIFQLLDFGNVPFSGRILDDSLSTEEDHSTDNKAKLGLYPYGLNPNPSVEPSAGSIYKYIPTEIRTYFDRAFTGDSTKRPTAKEWFKLLKGFMEDWRFEKCDAYPDDPFHHHFKGMDCFACQIGAVDDEDCSPVTSASFDTRDTKTSPTVKKTQNKSDPQTGSKPNRASQAPVSAEQTIPVSTSEPMYFPVSITKLVVMSIVTLGLYQLYWGYKNWKSYKLRSNADIMPIARAIFGVFYTYPLFGHIARDAEQAQIKSFPAGVLAIVWILLAAIAPRLPDPFWLITFLSFCALIPVQKTINQLNQKAVPTHDQNRKFGILNWLAIVLMGLVVIVVALNYSSVNDVDCNGPTPAASCAAAEPAAPEPMAAADVEPAAPAASTDEELMATGMWHDRETNLVWTRCSLGQTWEGGTCTGESHAYTWIVAQDAVAEMNHNGGFGGYTDWVVPHIEDLASLIRCDTGFKSSYNIPAKAGGEITVPDGCKDGNKKPAIDQQVFPNSLEVFWSASPSKSDVNNAWVYRPQSWIL